MSFNPSKCSPISITRAVKEIIHKYNPHSKILKQVQATTYTGVNLSCSLTWKTHIKKTCAKANKQLTFLKQNLQIKQNTHTKVTESAYKGLFHPPTKYCATIWDPYHKKYIRMLTMVQRRFAHSVYFSSEDKASATDILNRLGWESFELRRLRARLTMFYKIQDNLAAIPLPQIIHGTKTTKPRASSPSSYTICQNGLLQIQFLCQD